MELKFLLGIINSKLANFLLDQIRGIGNIDINPEYLKNIPIPIAQIEDQLKVIEIVDKILELKQSNTSTHLLECQLDHLIYKLYKLRYDEVKMIDPEFELSESEYDNL